MGSKDRKSSIRSVQDLGIALGVFAIACGVIALITMPAIGSVLPAVVAGNVDCENCEVSAVSIIGDIGCGVEMNLPAGSSIWMCEYLVYSNKTGDLIGINLCDDEDWLRYGDIITEITGLDNRDEWQTLYHDMLYKKCYVNGYLQDQGFYVISCLDCNCFWYLIDMADNCDCPVRIVMYDCCCVTSMIIPVFVY